MNLNSVNKLRIMKLSLNFCNWQEYQWCTLCKSPPQGLALPHHLHASFQRPGQQQLYIPSLLSTALQLWPMFLILLLTPYAKNLTCPFPWHLLPSSQPPISYASHLQKLQASSMICHTFSSPDHVLIPAPESHVSQQIHTSHTDLRLSLAHLA